MIGIVDYGSGNLTSVAAAVTRLGHDACVTADAGRLRDADKLILPGVGAFGDCVANLRARGLDATLDDLVRGRGRPILGICVGAQMMAREGEEMGAHEGLGWIDARVTRLEPGSDDLRLPHVGWNEVTQLRETRLFTGIPADALFYFVHSYCLRPAVAAGLAVGVCEYGETFCAAFQQDNIYGVQFHPEKSQRHGLALIENFIAGG